MEPVILAKNLKGFKGTKGNTETKRVLKMTDQNGLNQFKFTKGLRTERLSAKWVTLFEQANGNGDVMRCKCRLHLNGFSVPRFWVIERTICHRLKKGYSFLIHYQTSFLTLFSSLFPAIFRGDWHVK